VYSQPYQRERSAHRLQGRLPQPVHIAAEPSKGGISSQSPVRVVALTVLFAAAAIYEAIHLSAVLAPGVWIHLRTGLWILHNRSFPHTGLFSQSSNLPWNDSSWGFQVILGAAYHIFGLRALPILLVVFKVALAVATFLLARAGRARFWGAILLSALAQFLISGLQPMPSAPSILFLALELVLLVRSRQSGSVRELFWLPLLFLLWANLDIEFVFGLLVLALFVLAVGFEQASRSLGATWVSDRIQPLDLPKAGGAALLSLLATFANPYTVHPLAGAFRTLYSHAAFEHFSEMKAMTFRQPQDFLLMLLVMTAFLSLGRRRSLDLFGLLTLLAGTLIAFRAQREGWLAVLPAIGWISHGLNLKQEQQSDRKWVALPAVALAGIIAVALVPDSNTLMNKVRQRFPVKACDYIQANHLPAPLYNAYIWGSFLTWYLPEYPVAVDSRVELYGDDFLSKYFEVAGGKERLETDPVFSRSSTLLLEKESAMAKALTNLPVLSAQYRLVYSDDLASVFVRRAASP